MCGIFFRCSRADSGLPSASVQERLAKRGPDALESLQCAVTCASTPNCVCYLAAVSSVLSLRGNNVTRQPITDQTGNPPSFLCWNGEAWKWDCQILDCSDTEFIFDQLAAASRSVAVEGGSPSSQKAAATQSILHALKKISGPFAFVFYDSSHQLIFYGRDALGRRSLLQRTSADHDLELASICDDTDPSGTWTEIKADGIYVLDLESMASNSSSEYSTPSIGPAKPRPVPWQSAPLNSEASHRLRRSPLLEPPPAFDAGTQQSLPAPDLDKVDEPPLTLDSTNVQMMLDHLEAAVRIRSNPALLNFQNLSVHSGLAVLFSGGLDCTLLARVCHKVLGPNRTIDLVNVAFENPRATRAAAERLNENNVAVSSFEHCPDRISARASHSELTELCPERIWNFVTADVSYAELTAHRNDIIALLEPKLTEMDFSIGCALYFAARGHGRMQTTQSESPEVYVTPARILFSGLGADELFGGYTRHARAFERTGLLGLMSEMELDFNRISERNLGRDDRIISNWGKEVRYPFLDEDFVAWTLSVPVSQRCGFGQQTASSPDLEPSKLLLRLGAWHLGLRGAARQKKRAIQFGARTAKMENGRTKGTQPLR